MSRAEAAEGSPRPGIHEVRDLAQVKALSHPLRLRILEELASGPERTTKQVAEALGEPPTRLYHHVATLERAGLVELVATRPNRGATEKYFRAVAGMFRVDPDLFDELGAGARAGATRDLLLRAAEELGRLEARRTAATADDRKISRPALLVSAEVRGTEERLNAVRRRLERLLERLQGEGEGEDAEPDELRRFRLLLAWYPLDDGS